MISIIIPTHNRVRDLLDTLNTLLACTHEAILEIIVVDNNCSDGTAAEVHRLQQHHPELIRYVHEPRRAACAARNTGARHAHGDILLFLDDDVRVQPGSLARIQQIFDTYPNCGMVAALVLPRFETEPPSWTHACQESYNGWSLYHPGNRPHLAKGFQEDDYAMGAMHALTRQAFEKAGGYPPDIVIIGEGPLAYRLDIGAGDTGLSSLVKKYGFTIIYDPLVCCHHLVASTRFTPQFWRARMVSEAHYHTVSKRVFWKMRPAQLLLDRKRVQMEFVKAIRALKNRLTIPPPAGGIYPEEMWIHYYHAYLSLDSILRQFPSFCGYLDELSRNGVPEGTNPEDSFPDIYRAFVAYFFSSPLHPLQSVDDLVDYLARIDEAIRTECEQTEKLLSSLFECTNAPLETLREQLKGARTDGARLLFDTMSQDGSHEWLLPWLVALLAEAGDKDAVASLVEALHGQFQVDEELAAIAHQLGIELTLTTQKCTPLPGITAGISAPVSSEGAHMTSMFDQSGTQAAQRLLYSQYRQSVAAGVSLPSFAEAGFRVFSQTDEDGILLMLFAAIGMTNRFCVDMAFHSPLGANTTNLICNWGWNGFMVEGDSAGVTSSQEWFANHPDTKIFPPKIIQAWITAENVNQLLLNNDVEGEVDLLSLDVDGVDIWLWNALTAISPRVIVLEFMNIWGADASVTVPYSPDFNRHNYHADFFGASLPAFVKLGQVKGYRLVGCNRLGYNAFFLRNDIADNLFPEVTAESCLALPYPQYARATRLKAVSHLPWQQV